MRVLVACEESQRVCMAFRERGHEAFSCDIVECSGGYFSTERYGKKAEERWKKRVDAVVFFMRFAGADYDRIAIENPIGIMSTSYRKPDQIIHPWMFALEEYEKTEKSTCLWLKGLPKLRPLHTEKPEIAYKEWTDKNGRHKRQTLWYYQTRCLAHEERAKAASKTFPGVAAAFAEQWG